ncbi:MAG: tail fiber domain-containing protein [Clostridia bacterium]
MSNIGYREIFDLDALSLKLLNDNLRALWGKVMGDIALRDLGSDTTALIDAKADIKALDAYATITQTTDMIGTKVGAVDGRVTAVEQTATGLTARVTTAEGNLSTVQQTATGLTARVTTAEGNISTVQQTANGLTSRVSSVEGSVSQVQQTASGLQSTVTGLDGRLSKVEQNNTGVAISLKDPDSFTTYEIRADMMNGGPGIAFNWGPNDTAASIRALSESFVINAGTRMLRAWCREMEVTGPVNIDGHVTPGTSGQYSLGTRSPNPDSRWKNVNITGSVDTSSDLRLKTDVSPLDMAELLGHLRPIRYRMIADGENGKVRWGFGAQHVREALGALGVQDVEFLDQENPEHLALCYTELIAVLVEGYQKLSARVAQLEKTLAKGGA